MDPVGVSKGITALMLNGTTPVDIACIVGDGDGKITKTAIQTKKAIIDNKKYHKHFPWLKYCSYNVHRQFCIVHMSKCFGKRIKKAIKLFRNNKNKINKSKGKYRLPNGCSENRICKYGTTVFNDVIKSNKSTNTKRNMISEMWKHCYATSKHDNAFCNESDHCSKQGTSLCIPYGLVLVLNNASSKFANEDMMAHMSLGTTTNRVESYSQSYASKNSKAKFLQNTAHYDMLSYVVGIQANHGDSGMEIVLEDLGFRGKLPVPYTQHLRNKQEKKKRKRKETRTIEYKDRRDELKMQRAINNAKVKTNSKIKYQSTKNKNRFCEDL